MSDKDQVNEEGLHEEEVQQELDPNQEESSDNQETEADPIAKLEDEVKDLKDQNLRLYAEFENFRRRTEIGRAHV